MKEPRLSKAGTRILEQYWRLGTAFPALNLSSGVRMDKRWFQRSPNLQSGNKWGFSKQQPRRISGIA